MNFYFKIGDIVNTQNALGLSNVDLEIKELIQTEHGAFYLCEWWTITNELWSDTFPEKILVKKET